MAGGRCGACRRPLKFFCFRGQSEFSYAVFQWYTVVSGCDRRLRGNTANGGMLNVRLDPDRAFRSPLILITCRALPKPPSARRQVVIGTAATTVPLSKLVPVFDTVRDL